MKQIYREPRSACTAPTDLKAATGREPMETCRFKNTSGKNILNMYFQHYNEIGRGG